jgi:hypothetical protein
LWESLAGQPQPAPYRKTRNAERKSPMENQALTLERILRRNIDGAKPALREESELRAALEACEQLAIHFERRAHAIDRAMQMTRHGLALLSDAQEVRGVNRYAFGETVWQKWEERLTRRLKRLEIKNGRATANTSFEMAAPGFSIGAAAQP